MRSSLDPLPVDCKGLSAIPALDWANVLSPDLPDRFDLAVRPRNGGAMFTYRLHFEDGSDAGEATYSVLIRPGEEILVGNGRALPRARRRAVRRGGRVAVRRTVTGRGDVDTLESES